MRHMSATLAAVVAVSVVTSTTVFAQKKNTDATRAQARGSINQSYNRCVALAKARGFARSDIGDQYTPARDFVVRCMQGKQN